MKQVLPTYNICNLNEKPLLHTEFIAEHFDEYLETHKNLHFPHKHSFYHLVYFTQGTGSHSIDFINFPVEPGQIYFMIPGQVHSWNFKSAANGFIVNFSADFIHELLVEPRYLERFSFFSGIANSQVVSVPKEKQSQLLHLFETIVSEGTSNLALKNDMVRLALIQLFILVDRTTETSNALKPNYNSIMLRNFQKLVDLHYRENTLPKNYAAMLYVTPNHLNALCKDITGRAAGELIRDRILLEAKRLLVNADMTIAEVANELNFSDNSYFTKFFKKYESISPEEFRKQFVKAKS